ncbi:MAG: methyltransferase [Betaproteobacteria bacterium RBG_16_58_11]|nr:MAG: methyltransferase [Betaproteobacteria bacterium RBG_16_58_11]
MISEILALAREVPAFFVGFVILLGLIIGSFLNVVIHRLPKMMACEWRLFCAELDEKPAPDTEPFNLFTPHSRCPSCGHAVRAIENIPLLSYAFLRGKCRHCSAPISPRYPIVEALTGVISGYVAWRFGVSFVTLAALLFCWALIALTFIDADTQLLPDQITQPLIWLGLLANLGGLFTDIQSSVMGAVAGYFSLWTVYWLFKLATGKEGMGYGDFKLLAAIGAWLGWQLLPVVILLSSLVGAMVGVSLILFARHERSQPIPFGPYLAGGGIIALLWGQDLTQAYLNWLH